MTTREEGSSPPEPAQKAAQFHRFLTEEVWPLVPGQLGQPLPKPEQEALLGLGPDGF